MLVVSSGVLLFYILIRFLNISHSYSAHLYTLYPTCILYKYTLLILWQNPVAGSCKAGIHGYASSFLFFLSSVLSLFCHRMSSSSCPLSWHYLHISPLFFCLIPASPLFFFPLSPHHLPSCGHTTVSGKSPSAYSRSACSVTQDLGGLFFHHCLEAVKGI